MAKTLTAGLDEYCAKYGDPYRLAGRIQSEMDALLS